MKRIVFATLIGCSVTFSTSVWAAFASEGTQIANNIQLAQQYSKQLQQYDAQIQQLETALQQAKQITGLVPWSQTENLISNIMSVNKSTNALTSEMSNIEQTLRDQYPAYLDQQIKSGQDFYNAYESASNITVDSIKASITAGGMQMDNIKSEMDVVKKLRDMSNSAEGQMQAAQIANALAVEQLEDAKKMRQLLVTQNAAQNTFLMQEQQERDRSMKMQQDFLQEMKADGF